MDGEVGLGQFTEERLSDLRLHQLIQKVHVTPHPDLTKQYPEAMPNEVEITTKGGKRYKEMVLYPEGHPKNPMDDEGIERKFKGLVERSISPSRVDRLLDRLWHLEEMEGVREIVDLWVIGDERG